MSHEYTEWNISKANYQIEKGRKKVAKWCKQTKNTFFNVNKEPPWNKFTYTHHRRYHLTLHRIFLCKQY